MPSSESPATSDGESDPSIEVYESDVDANMSEEQDSKEEVDVEEEENEEEEEEGEGEEEEELEHQGEESVSPASAEKSPKDLGKHMEFEGQDGNLRLPSSVAENPGVMLPSSRLTMEKKNAQVKVSVPSPEMIPMKKGEFHPNEEISSAPKSINQIRQLEMQSRDDNKQIESRFIVPDTSSRSLSPSADMKDGNKRQAIICSFFAKGWCIKGGSCRFLHVKDNVSNTGQQAERDLVNADHKREVQPEEGFRDNSERSPIPGTSVPSTASMGSTSLYSSELSSKQTIQNKQEACQNSRANSRDRLFPENGFSFHPSKNYFSTNLSSYSNHKYSGYTSPFTSHLHYACRSTLSGSEWENLSLVSSSGVPLHSTGYRSKICSYNWEPSVPFQPSFFISSTSMSSPGAQYTTLHDKIEIPNIGDGSLKATILIQGSSNQASSQLRTYGESAVAGNQVADLNDDKSSVSSHKRSNENEPIKRCVPQEKDCLANETETTAGSYLHGQTGKMGMGENNFGVEDITRTEKDIRLQGEGSGQKTNRIDRDRKNSDIEVDSRIGGSVQKDPKVLKNFRVALVDLVKDLLKPTWHDGRLSKDAHILIVKKSVDKILSTLQPHQIPITLDNINHFVLVSRPKIAKLVDGYVNKYGKS
ncbi:hypothetical protein L6164_032875 [Bauhinia variegata]|uniref:Uncharacterized protein n=1 Tax=Bauhinia variegata TaxID=167791 RepID=A0ACB9KQ51_BAUVA|nr:hypothetical protein L6164_032875 [Bauhinia variegata]